MASLLAAVHPFITPLHTPLHKYVPIAPLDIFGAIRLSQIVYWISNGVLSPETSTGGSTPSKRAKKGVKRPKAPRPDALQECLGLMIVLFGGETFLGKLNTDLLKAKKSLTLCAREHLHHGSSVRRLAYCSASRTRSSLRHLIPAKPTLRFELLLSIPDAIGRTLFLTRFSIIPLIDQYPNFFRLPPTSASLILVPFILASPFAALAFTGANLFSPMPSLSTPMELAPRGWLMVDAWLPLVLPAVFCTLVGPMPGWEVGMGWGEDEAVVACLGLVIAAFLGRTVYNYGHSRDQWEAMLGIPPRLKKAVK